VHEGGWTVTRAAGSGTVSDTAGVDAGTGGGFLFHSPSGATLEPIPAPPEPVVHDVDWIREWAQEHGIELGPETNFPQWDGSRPDYTTALDCLLND